MSEERGEPREDRVRPPEHVHLYIAPGMDTISFADLLLGSGIRRDLGEMLDNMSMQIASLQEQINELQSRVGADPQEAEPQQEQPRPATPPPQRPAAPPPGRRPHR